MRQTSLQSVKSGFLKIKFLSICIQFAGLMLLSLLLLYPPAFLQGMIFYIFQERDLARAQELLNGSMIFFGPELTGGGNLPGPFYYFLLTPPLLLGLGWMGTWYWMFFLLSLGGALGWYFLRSKFDSLTAFLWLILYSLIKPTAHLMQIFVNPSFSILFIVLINIYILKAYSDNAANKRNRSFIIACFLTGLAIQIHYSSITYIFALISLQIFAKKLKIFSIDAKKFYKGMAAFGITWTPYLFWLTLKKFEIELGQPLPYGGSMTNAVPSLLAHFMTTLDTSAGAFLSVNLKKIFIVTPLVFLIYAVLKLFLRGKNEGASVQASSSTSYSSLINIFKVCLFFTFIPVSFYFFVPQGSRYGAPFVITLSFLAAVLYNKIISEKRQLKYFNVIGLMAIASACILVPFLDLSIKKYDYIKIMIFLISFVLIAYFHRAKYQKNNFAILLSFITAAGLTLAQFIIQNNVYAEIHSETNMPKYRHWQRIWPKIYNETGWSYREAFERIYFVNHQREQSTKSAYQMFAKKTSENTRNFSKSPDGYFVSIDKPDGLETLNWLLEQPIQQEVRDGLLSGDIVIGKHRQQNNLLIAPYFVVNKKSMPAYFHNAGWGYDKLPEENLFQGIKEFTGAKKITENKFLFKWNECPKNHRYCDTGVIIDIATEPHHVFNIDVKVVGLPLSQSSRWISPAWTQLWIEPYLEIKCGKTTTKLIIASSIGYNQKYLGLDRTYKYPMANNSFLAPFKRTFKAHCNQPLSEISLGRESSLVDQIPDYLINLPPQRLSIQL